MRIVIIAVSTLLILPQIAGAKPSLSNRVERLERVIDGQITVDLLNKLDTLQQEVLELRGRLEERDHEIQRLYGAQQELDRKIEQQRLKSATSATQPAKSSAKQTQVIAEKQPLAPVANAESSEKSVYLAAKALMDQQSYEQATTAFEDFLWKFPNGQYAANAYYWLGELFLSHWQSNQQSGVEYDKAIRAFSTVAEKFPKHHKAEDALLKLGLVAYETNDYDSATKYLSQLIDVYPDSPRVSMAKAKLQALSQN